MLSAVPQQFKRVLIFFLHFLLSFLQCNHQSTANFYVHTLQRPDKGIRQTIGPTKICKSSEADDWHEANAHQSQLTRSHRSQLTGKIKLIWYISHSINVSNQLLTSRISRGNNRFNFSTNFTPFNGIQGLHYGLDVINVRVPLSKKPQYLIKEHSKRKGTLCITWIVISENWHFSSRFFHN
jgi:hypothetical protein